MEVLIYLIIIVVALMAKTSSMNKKASGQNQRPGTAPQNRQSPARPAQPQKRPLTQEEVRRAAEMPIGRQQPRPAQPTVNAKPAAVKPKVHDQAPAPADGGFYQGTSFGDEGIDPCHDDLYGDREPDDAQAAGTAQPAFGLRFTADSVLNGVIMSEVLNRRV